MSPSVGLFVGTPRHSSTWERNRLVCLGQWTRRMGRSPPTMDLAFRKPRVDEVSSMVSSPGDQNRLANPDDPRRLVGSACTPKEAHGALGQTGSQGVSRRLQPNSGRLGWKCADFP